MERPHERLGRRNPRRVTAVRGGRLAPEALRLLALAFSLASTLLVVPGAARAAETLSFSTSAVGQKKAIDEWGYDTAWPSYDNARLSILSFGGSAAVDVVRVNFHEFEALAADGSLGPQGLAAVDYAASLVKLAGTKAVSLTPDTGAGTAAWYLDATGGVNVDRYAAVIRATARRLSDQHGLSVGDVEIWNEPDYWPGQPTAAQFAGIAAAIKADPLLAAADIVGPSTLSPNAWWYDQVAGVVNVGSTHKLGGSAAAYVDFLQRVRATGDAASNPEPHGLAEVIMGAEYGVSSAIWWGPALHTRGQFVQASDGMRLGYAENRGTETAAAVYRGPSGRLQAFTGGFERQGSSTPYRLVSTDRDVWFNGVGPIRECMITATRDVQGGLTDITFGSDAIGQGTALDGNRWTIVNKATGQVLQVTGSSLVNGGGVNAATDSGSLTQRWNVRRSDDGYYTLLNANSGIALDMANGSLADGGVAQQWGGGDALPQLWTIEAAGNGVFTLRNGNSGKYLTGDPTRAYQKSLDGSTAQQWQFVLANPAVSGSLRARYDFQGSGNDSAGSRHATIAGVATYVAGPTPAEGTALAFNGSSTYATLPAGVATSADITLSSWVKWNGGGSWQRIFDCGNDTSSYMFLTPSSGDGTMRFAITTASGTGEQILDTTALPVGRWMHLAVTLSGNTGVLYVDGAPRVAGRITLDPADVNATRNYLGKSQYADPLFAGALDDFRIYDYALTRAEIANLVPVSKTTWTGAADGWWRTAATASPLNWKTTFSGAASDYVDADTIQFDDTASAFAVRTDEDVRPLVTTFHHAKTYTLSGSAGISGTGALVKNGFGLLTLANRNTYTGATTINSGTVNLTGSLGATSIIVDAAVFTQPATGAIIGGSLRSAGLTTLAGSNQFAAVHASGPSTMTIAGGSSSMASLAVGGAAGDRASVVVSGGVVSVADGIVIGGGGSGSLSLATGGTLATTAITGGIGTSAVTFGGGVLRALTSGTGFMAGLGRATVGAGGLVLDTNGFDVVVPQGLSHDPELGSGLDGGLVKRGLGTLTLAGANTFTGSTSIVAGAIVIGAPAALGTGTVAFASGTLVMRQDGDLANPLAVGTLRTATLVSDILTAGPAANHRVGTLVVGPGSGVTALATGSWSTGRPTFTVSAVTLGGAAAGTATFTGNSAALSLGRVGSTTNYAKTLTLTGTGSGNQVTGTIANGVNVVSVVKNGPGEWILSGSSTYTGLTTINAGRLAITGSLAGSTIVNAGGSLSGTGSLKTVAVFSGGTMAPGIVGTPGTMKVGGTLSLAAGSTLAIDLATAAGGLSFDACMVTGDVSLGGGILDLAAIGDVRTEWLVSHDIVAGRSLTGTFARIDGVDLGNGRRLAVSYSATSAIVKVATAGDTNVDGVIDILDMAGLMSAGLFDAGTGGRWDRGDFNGDGVVDVIDVADTLTGALFDAAPYAVPPAAITAVPEPSILIVAPGLMVAAVASRWRRPSWARCR